MGSFSPPPVRTGRGVAYLDHAATTPLDPAVAAAMAPWSGSLAGNASSLHSAGVAAATAVERARLAVGGRLGVDPEEIVFTSGGTEANNLAVKGVAFARRNEGRHIVTSSVEHPSVAAPLRWLEQAGFEVTRLPVNGHGVLDPDDLRRALWPGTILVTLLHGNNEIGTLQDLGAAAAICRERGVPLHVDACQSFTKVEIDAGRLSLDLVSVNAHKLHGPQGVGALYVRRGVPIEPLLQGGGQERGLRPGTHNVAGIVGLGEAVKQFVPDHAARIEELRGAFVREMGERFPRARVLGHPRRRLCSIVSVTFPDIDGKALHQELDRRGVCASLGSACASGSPAPSPVLLAIGLDPEAARRTVRFSLGRGTTKEELDYALQCLEEVLTARRGAS